MGWDGWDQEEGKKFQGLGRLLLAQAIIHEHGYREIGR